MDEKDEEKKKQVELEAGKTVQKVRVKEVNYFDGVPYLTMRKETVGSAALDYGSIEVGQFVNGTIESVNEVRKTVCLRLNEFVKGTLRLEHMADYATKTIPPKFTQIEKQIKVRVFSVEGRTILFTKKDSLMKHDVPIYPYLKAVK